MKRVYVLVMALAGTGWMNDVHANLMSIGDPFDSDSWGQGFVNSSGPYYAFDKMLVSSISGAGFEAPAFRNFSTGGWSTTQSGSVLWAVAAGPTVGADSSITFDVIFNGSRSTALAFDFYAFQGDALKEATRATWNGSGWNFSVSPAAPPTVPDGGGTLVLLGVAAFGLGFLHKRTPVISG